MGKDTEKQKALEKEADKMWEEEMRRKLDELEKNKKKNG